MSINTRFAHIAAPTADELAVARYMAADQFMGHCWSLSFDYEEYAFHAARLQYRVYTEAEYIDYCRSQDEQMASYFAVPAASALHTITTNVHGTNVPATPVQLDYICVWPDGMYCSPDELNTMTHRSDDYARVAVGPDEDEAVVAQAYADQANKAFTSVMQALGAAPVQGASILEQHWG